MYQGVPLYRCREAAARTQIPIYRCEVIKVPIRGKTKNSEKQAGAKLGIKSEGDGLRGGGATSRQNARRGLFITKYMFAYFC